MKPLPYRTRAEIFLQLSRLEMAGLPYAKAVASLWREYLTLVESLREPEPEPVPMAAEEEALHEQALAAVAMSDPVEWAADERREQMREP